MKLQLEHILIKKLFKTHHNLNLNTETRTYRIAFNLGIYTYSVNKDVNGNLLSENIFCVQIEKIIICHNISVPT